MPLIVIDNVTKRYFSAGMELAILKRVSLSIEHGEFVALMGPSGSGKSTLLTVLGAMNRPTVGKVAIDGIDVYGLGEEKLADFRREYIGFVFQQHHLLPFLTAFDNVALPLASGRHSARERNERGYEALEWVGLADKSQRLPGQLSGGEQGRLAIARALVNRPALILADEPTGALDSGSGAEVIRLFRRLSDSGKTVFMVTHNPINGEAADRIIYMQDGAIASLGGSRATSIQAGALPGVETSDNEIHPAASNA